MAVNWNAAYELQPENFSNPGYGAEEIREDKVGVRERVELEHAFGPDEQTVANDGGRHLEGSGRLWVEDDEVAGETDTDRETRGSRLDPGSVGSVPVNDLVGRTVVDLNKLPALPETDGTPIAATNILNRVRDIKVYDANGDLLTVFDPDTFVSAVLDQVVSGIKTYSHKVRLEQDTSDAQYDALGASEKALADKEATKRATIKTWTEDAKKQNVFDPNDQYNKDESIVQSYSWTDADITAWAGSFRSTEDITCNRFAATEVRAEKLYGAVYG